MRRRWCGMLPWSNASGVSTEAKYAKWHVKTPQSTQLSCGGVPGTVPTTVQLATSSSDAPTCHMSAECSVKSKSSHDWKQEGGYCRSPNSSQEAGPTLLAHFRASAAKKRLSPSQ